MDSLKIKDTLPHKLWQLLQLALDDLKKVENDDKYSICMDLWHFPIDGVCEVCLAGAVMAKTLEADTMSQFHPSQFGSKLSCKLKALNFLRIGQMGLALTEMGYQENDIKGIDYKLDTPDYIDNPKIFHSFFNGIVLKLKELDL